MVWVRNPYRTQEDKPEMLTTDGQSSAWLTVRHVPVVQKPAKWRQRQRNRLRGYPGEICFIFLLFPARPG
ncbi:MAG: hypothetical protein CSH36_00705 [Thalassolituus sp.]|nr:MAG: hypothetical protein CSH36_00705 [Thalassolituus sp.]